ncbi:MAG: DUF4199 domain-containing protein [Muribaculaceae bacterium]|nr:DUF4199 domain-containing protein [Muribaculaceae bacterium]MDE6119814.1 DUF4199 domain-containing protein [Muribaculaceae bacterium]
MFDQNDNQSGANYSPFRRGAEDGVLFGVYLGALSVCMLAGLRVSVLEVLFLILAVGVPFYCFRRQRRSYVSAGGSLAVAPLWMQGIVMFFCGSIIMALVTMIYLQWVDPDYLAYLKAMVTESVALDPGAFAASGIKPADIDNLFAIITPAKFAVEMLWLSIFTGSILSLLTAVIVPLKRIPQKR